MRVGIICAGDREVAPFLPIISECKTTEIAEFLHLKPTQTKSYLRRLVSEGRIVAKGNNRNRTYCLV